MKNQSQLSIVGAGITGLMVAYKASQKNPGRTIHVIDEGPDPRSVPRLSHRFGATYSGLNARHISITETGPWTTEHRLELFSRPAEQGGWNCLSNTSLTIDERQWLSEFNRIASDTQAHERNYRSVMELNRA